MNGSEKGTKELVAVLVRPSAAGGGLATRAVAAAGDYTVVVAL